MLGAGCATGVLAGVYGQLVIDRYLRRVTGFPVATAASVARPLELFALVLVAVLLLSAIPGWLASRVRPRWRSMNRSSMAPAAVALARANLRYWPTVAPATGRELAGWEARARGIPDPRLRSLALSKLSEEHFNAQVSTTLATLLPRAARPRAVRALVALKVAYDYLDGLTELPAEDPLGGALALFASFTGALEPPGFSERHPDRDAPGASAGDDGGYLAALGGAVRGELAALPSWPALAPVAHAAAQRTAQAQARLHAAPPLGDAQLCEWAAPLADGAGLGWREFLAGAAASVLACHALIVAAATRGTTTADAERLDGFYLRLCALSTLLDALVDRAADARSGADSLLRSTRTRSSLLTPSGLWPARPWAWPPRCRTVRTTS